MVRTKIRDVRYRDTYQDPTASTTAKDGWTLPPAGRPPIRGNGPIPAIDLFCGAGGASLGMHQTPEVEVLAAVDHDEHAVETHRRNLSHPAVEHDLRDVDLDVLRRIIPADWSLTDIMWVHGSPPCKEASHAQGNRATHTETNELVADFVTWVKRLKPYVVTMENVVGMTTLDNGRFMEYVEALFEWAGYRVRWEVLNAAEYGVPQRRKRVICVAVPAGAEQTARYWFPQPTHAPTRRQTLSGRELAPYQTTREAIGDLPHPGNNRTLDDCADPLLGKPPNHNPPNHSPEKRREFAEYEQGKTYGSVTESRLDPDRPARTMCVSSGTAPIHYAGDEETARRLTVREVARLQSFPDTFEFYGTKAQQYRQGGNAVPPLLQRRLAAAVKRNLSAMSNRHVPYSISGYTPPTLSQAPRRCV